MEQVLTVVVIALVYLGIFMVFSNKKKLDNRLINRNQNDPKEFEQFYSADQIKVAISLQKILSKYVSIDVKHIRPEDELCNDLGLGFDDGMDVEDFVDEIEKKCMVKIPDEDASNIRSFQQLVDVVTMLQKVQL